MSMMARINANLEAAIAEQLVRHAAEEGRDIAREQCVEVMIMAMEEKCCPENADTLTAHIMGNLRGIDFETLAEIALDAAIASGYVVRPK
jgi:hypothetical protein